jgi:hypothetical protein
MAVGMILALVALALAILSLLGSPWSDKTLAVAVFLLALIHVIQA